ncbi:MAG: protein phosphatase 2C domain-containing protein, partial [Myxococcota bacterium]|nr:protein phosphatase 2C domain-containing protein [Myxococcota bacterium]
MNRELIASGSRTGPRHAVNQDRCAHWRGDDLIIALVADGVGGHEAGERAAWLLVDSFVQHLGVVGFGDRLERLREKAPPGPISVAKHLPGPVQWVEAILRRANDRILDEASGLGSGAIMATTAVVSVVDRVRGSFHVCHVGDSRAYLYADQGLRQITRDHVEGTPDHNRRRQAVTRAIGAHLVLPLEITPTTHRGTRFSQGDVLMLCTDGISEPVSDHHMFQVLHGAGEDLSTGVDRLLLEVERRRGNDDASVVLVMPIAVTIPAAAQPALPPEIPPALPPAPPGDSSMEDDVLTTRIDRTADPPSGAPLVPPPPPPPPPLPPPPPPQPPSSHPPPRPPPRGSTAGQLSSVTLSAPRDGGGPASRRAATAGAGQRPP